MTDEIKVPDGYSFVRTVSSGVFGNVVEMISKEDQTHYAGKLIQCITLKDRERIAREISRLRKFAHPGIVGLKEVASMDNSKVIVMELGGQSLADIVRDHRSRGVLVAREVVYRVMVDVSSALNLMHNDSSEATAHGDVKMENILLFGGGHFKLCDLGAAESEDESCTRSVMSQLYVSPERMESETGRATCSSDVWALGIVLHWLLFGEPPFKLGQVVEEKNCLQRTCPSASRLLLQHNLLFHHLIIVLLRLIVLRSPHEQPTPETGGQSRMGAAAIDLFSRNHWTESGNVFTKLRDSYPSLISFETAANTDFVVGIISSRRSNDALARYFPNQKGGAGWRLHPDYRYAIQNNKTTKRGSACLKGSEGQRVVLEADGREGKRTLKLSQNRKTAPVYFVNIPVPFRFAVSIYKKNDAVEIESVEVVSAPQMVGGTKSVKMDE
ncbi:putative Spindle assembly checkpoint kinase [Blattamonas nauphoetae]|uniref:mitogen-activated protein kinase kinase n=1 Tax=Blattamonas nauphoetae TaxID=2049346 RepID=A0ABQ9XCR0_9EUKA|nr:putative Spindle assembly checkpoint kinase [Blattamonas nauphoetae]